MVTMSTLPVRSPLPNKRALDPLGARHQRELRRRDRRAAIIVRMNGQDHARAVGDVTPEPLELVCVGVGRRHLDGRRQVENEALAWAWA